MRILSLFLYTMMLISTSAYAGDEQTATEAGVFCSGCSQVERAAFINARDGLLTLVSMEVHGRCNTHGDCPGSAWCRNGRCERPNGDGTECDSPGDCPGSAWCRHGRCERPNGDGTECDSPGDCPGSEWCRNGRCS